MKTQSVIFTALVAVAIMLIASVAPAQGGKYAASRAHLLDLDMSEEKVMSLIGKPDKVSIQTCGQKTESGNWTCKVHEYTSVRGTGNYTYEKTNLTVLYYKHERKWHLSAFRTY